jgi:hypothetical protein
MLAGQRHDLLTIVYGPAKKATWPLLMNNPRMLVERNGLWEAILDVSDAILVDASTDKVTNHGFLREHWLAGILTPKQRSILVEAKPSKIGENDVDTVLHILLARFAGESVFEGMCNPPGGDWSGVSLKSADRSVEMRWVSLPRVSGAVTKRPDHVFEFFGISAKPVILSIESKDTPNAVEQRIGPRLIDYLMNLIASPASIERQSSSSKWQHSSARLRPSDFQFLSAVAYISNSEDDIRQVRAKASADLIFAFRFAADGQRCSILIIAENAEGRRVADAMGSIDLKNTGINVEVRQ